MITSVEIHYDQEVLTLLGKLATCCAELYVLLDMESRLWKVRCHPLWDPVLEVETSNPTLAEALKESHSDLRAMEAAEQCAEDAKD